MKKQEDKTAKGPKPSMPELEIVSTVHDDGALPVVEDEDENDDGDKNEDEYGAEEQETAEQTPDDKKRKKKNKKKPKDAAAENDSDDNADDDDENEDEDEDEDEDESTKEVKSALQQLKDFVNEDEDQPIHFDFRAFLGGDGLVKMFARNWCFISVIVFFTCCYVSSRYLMDGAKIENTALNDTLTDRRYKALTAESALKQHTLSSTVEKNLQDSTLRTPTEQSYTLPVKNHQ